MSARRRHALAWVGMLVSTAALAFEDREIPAETLKADVDDVAWSVQRIDPGGPPRTVSTELRVQASRIDAGPTSTTRWWLARGTLDTQNLGYLSVDVAYDPSARADLSGTNAASSRASVSIAQRMLPFEGGWFANNGLGLIQPGHPDLVASQYRFGVPTRTVLGASTAWSNEAQGLQLSLASGTPVLLDSVGQAGYAQLGGRATTLGFGVNVPHSAWRYAAEASDYRQGDGQINLLGSIEPSSRALMQVLRHEADGIAIQANVLNSKNTSSAGGPWRTGVWFDGSVQQGVVEHRFGINKLPDDQLWLGVAVPSGTQGGYYRWRWRTRQSLAEVQLDEQKTTGATTGSGSRYAQLWANVRSQQDQAHAIGLQSIVSRFGTDIGYSLLGFHETSVGDTSWRLLAGVVSVQDQRNQYQLGGELTTTLSATQLNASLSAFSDGSAKLGSDLALSAAQDLGNRTSFVLGFRRFNAIDADSAGTSLNASLIYRFTPAWTLSAALSESRGARVLRPVGVSSGPPSLNSFVSYTPRVQYGLLTLRYEWQAGSPTLPLGATAGHTGGGRIEGTVFLDTNGNERVDPGEQVVPNVLVILDGRYSVRSDPQGHYAFPFVAAGEHRLRILPDNIPLPWSVVDMNERRIEVAPRATSINNFAAVRN